MGAYKDLVGRQFGELTVIALSPLKTKHRGSKWLCRCSCGIEKVIAGGSLTSGNTKSCGNHPMFKDITGEKFGRLTVIKKSHQDKWGVWHWLCKCDCGNEISPSGTNLRAGKAPSCGCSKIEKNRECSTKHNLSRSRIYQTHTDMLQRCNNPNKRCYKYYGGRGIKVCKEWETFEGFWEWAQHSGYTNDLTIERINVDGNYCPENCTWIPLSQQSINTRATEYITYNNKTLTLQEWSKETGINRMTLYSRLHTRKWSIEKTLTTPVRRKPINK
jgi:hypothetical protein